MKVRSLLAWLTISTLPATLPLVAQERSARAATPAGYTLVWADEFNYQGLPDQTKWDYEEGFVRNHESQYYTRARLENARVEDGNLVIECRKESFTPANHAPVEYTVASLTTQNRASWQYGRIEVRAKLPQGKGVWPAIWTLGTNISKVGWSACGEIDIMEFVGKEPSGVPSAQQVIALMLADYQTSGFVLSASASHERGDGRERNVFIRCHRNLRCVTRRWPPGRIQRRGRIRRLHDRSTGHGERHVPRSPPA